MRIYPLVNWHTYGKSPFLMGKFTINRQFSIALLVYRRVTITFWGYPIFNQTQAIPGNSPRWYECRSQSRGTICHQCNMQWIEGKIYCTILYILWFTCKSGWWLTYPSEKSWSESQLGWWHSQLIWKAIMVPNHKADNYVTIDYFPIKTSIYKGFSMAMFQTTNQK